MKKLFTLFLAIVLICALASVSFALTRGDVYIKDDEYYDDPVSTLAPGETGYVFIGDYDKEDADSRDTPNSISISNTKVYDGENDKDVRLLSVSNKAEKKKISSGTYGWFAVLKVKSVSMSNYPEDGYDIDTTINLEYDWDDDNGGSFDINLDAIKYEESDDEFEDDLRVFTHEKDDDVDIELPDGDGTFTGVARKDFDVVASMNTDVNNTLLNKYPNADIRFYNGNGAVFPVTSGRMTINANSGDYCYSVDSNNKLVDRTSTWVSSKNAFVISTTTIGKYIISDTKLSASGTTAASSSSIASSEYIGTTPNPSNPALENPSTGACA